MRRTLFLALMLLIGATVFAQTQVAILNHNEEISMFYGANALANAHSAAVAGDIITLSSGSFNGCTITKPITLRGAGFENDTIANTMRTYTNESIYIDVPSDSLFNLTIEGIRFSTIYYRNVYKPCFIKCYIHQILSATSMSIIDDAIFINCYVGTSLGSRVSLSSFSYINSIVANISEEATILLYNSIVKLNYPHCGNPIYESLYAYNSIIINDNGYVSNCMGGNQYAKISSTSLLKNCITIKNGGNSLIESMTMFNDTNLEVDNYSAIFNSLNVISSIGDYTLKEEIAASFLGDDGTEVGLYGGLYPYNTKPNYMIVKKCNVASRATVDNKLSVEIEVISE